MTSIDLYHYQSVSGDREHRLSGPAYAHTILPYSSRCVRKKLLQYLVFGFDGFAVFHLFRDERVAHQIN
jgi:hypothetical protein